MFGNSKAYRHTYIVLSLGVLLLLMFVVPHAAAAEQQGVSICTEADKAEYALGEKISVNYSVTGGSGEYKLIRYRWEYFYENGGSGSTSFTELGDFSGVIEYTPARGGVYELLIQVTDADGTVTKHYADELTVHGIRIELNKDKDYLVTGDTLNVSYSITGGSGEYTVWTQWQTTIYEEGAYSYQDSDNKQSKQATGSDCITVTDPTTYSVDFSIFVIDSQGYSESKLITTYTIDSRSPCIQTFSDNRIVQAGQPVSVGYEVIGGNGLFEVSSLYWRISDSKTGETFNVNIEHPQYIESTGSYSFIPPFGDTVWFYISGRDSAGNSILQYNYDTIRIIGNKKSTGTLSVELVPDTSAILFAKEVRYGYTVSGWTGEFKSINVSRYTKCDYSTANKVELFNGGAESTGEFGDTIFLTDDYIRNYSGKIVSIYYKFEVEDIYGRKKTVEKNFTMGEPIPESYIVKGEGAGEELIISLESDKYEVEGGDEFTLHYQVRGGSGEYRKIGYTLYHKDGGYWQKEINEGVYTSKGTIKYKPYAPGEYRAVITVTDTGGNTCSAQTLPIRVKGLKLNIYAETGNCRIGDTLYVRYEVTGGSGDYTVRSVVYQEGHSIFEEYDQATGTFSYVVTDEDGEYVDWQIQAWDNVTGLCVGEQVNGIRITPDDAISLSLVSKQGSHLTYGDEAAFSYVISGGSGHYSVSYIAVYASEVCFPDSYSDSTVTYSMTDGFTVPKGEFTIPVPVGDSLQVTVRVIDDNTGEQAESTVWCLIEEVPSVSAPLVSKITLSKNQIHYGETTVLSYDISGWNDVYESVSVRMSLDNIVLMELEPVCGKHTADLMISPEFARDTIGLNPCTDNPAIELYFTVKDRYGRTNEKWFLVELLANGHEEAADEAVEATCTATGLTEGSHCAVCGEAIKAQSITPMLPHTYRYIPSVEATCTEDGHMLGVECSVCHTVFIEADVVPAPGHMYAAYDCIPASSGHNGTYSGLYCERCEKQISSASAISANAILILPDGIGVIEPEAFYGTGAQQIVVPGGVSSIQSGAFAGISQLKVVVLPDSITSIAQNAFAADAGVILYCSQGNSYVLDWAEKNHFPVVTY